MVSTRDIYFVLISLSLLTFNTSAVEVYVVSSKRWLQSGKHASVAIFYPKILLKVAIPH